MSQRSIASPMGFVALLGLWSIFMLYVAEQATVYSATVANIASIIGVLGGFATLVALYFLPVPTACARLHPQRDSILALIILLGWSFLGWAVALVWAYSAPRLGSALPTAGPPSPAP